MDSLLGELLDRLDEETARIETCLDRLSEEAVWKRSRAGVNSAGNLCLHLAGNESHYIGGCIGGSDYVRDRAGEFQADGGVTKEDLLERLREARDTTRGVFERLTAADFDRPVESNHPEKEPTVMRVIIHVVTHYSYHTGQVVLLTRLLQQGDENVLAWKH